MPTINRIGSVIATPILPIIQPTGGHQVMLQNVTPTREQQVSHRSIPSLSFGSAHGSAHRAYAIGAQSLRFGSDPDLHRFKEYYRKKAMERMKGFVSPRDFEVVQDGKAIRVPLPHVDIPEFTRGGQGGGVGSGPGQPGDPIGNPQEVEGNGNKAGEGAGEHQDDPWGIQITRSEIARQIIDRLKLPNLEPKGTANTRADDYKWTTVNPKGVNLHRKRTLKEAIKRTAKEQGEAARPEDVHVHPNDRRFISWQFDERPQHNVVKFYLLDVSGSMTDEQKEQARTSAFYLDTIIEHQFAEKNAELRGESFRDELFGEGADRVYVVHDTVAKEVSEKEFYNTRESGGTKISSAYKQVKKIIEERYPPDQWNIYVFHFSDGDNWNDDNPETKKVIDDLLPIVNEVGYVQTTSPYGSGEFKEYLERQYGKDHKKVRTSVINRSNSEDYGRMVKDLLGERSE